MAKRKLADMNAPVWFDGTNINEALFCDEFLSSRKIIFANGAFFTPDGRVTDDLPLRGEIYEELKCCAVNNIPRKITNILEVMKLAAHVEDFAPEADRIHLANGTLTLDGSFTEGRPDIVRSRLPVAYHPGAPAPAFWLSFLDGLLYAEDIPTLQEFIGYCLIPSNKGQRMMVIKGNGGEGKSQIGAVLGALIGSNMKDGSMFGGLKKYRKQAYYDAHPEMTLFTPEKTYRMEIFAAVTTDVSAAVYRVPTAREERDELVQWAQRNSEIECDVSIGTEDRIVTLSTCTGGDDDRFVVLAVLRET
mgnify:CR=1 FL=1